MRIISANGEISLQYENTVLEILPDVTKYVRIMGYSENELFTLGEYQSKERAKEVLGECTEAFSGLHPVTVYKFPEE